MASIKPTHIVEYRKLTDLKELDGNPRTIKKDQFERLKKSLQDNQDYFEARPLILSNRTGELVILAGNQRYKAAKAIGMTEVPTVLIEGLTEEREREIIIRDNVENGEWDADALANMWDAQELTEWGVEVPSWAIEPDDLDATDETEEFYVKISFKREKEETMFMADLNEKLDLQKYDCSVMVHGGQM